MRNVFLNAQYFISFFHVYPLSFLIFNESEQFV
ncbi:hypothetical protein predicted by Glimmer/Critica [Helicobacter pylori B8]|uniref:Uncharacterized protein n=1 Tax=Helicobacter pylori (strain B8) TaxID=693745 RepID=D7FD89_HELP3|nr:hypothetical protein predicted by Glimmer/Critica [Helicobacter pylori B8]